MFVPLPLVRAHLNLDPDDDRDAELLTHYTNVAEAYVAAYIGGPFAADNALMVQAALLLIAHQYESREGVTFSSPHQMPYGFNDLLSPLKERVTGHMTARDAA